MHNTEHLSYYVRFILKLEGKSCLNFITNAHCSKGLYVILLKMMLHHMNEIPSQPVVCSGFLDFSDLQSGLSALCIKNSLRLFDFGSIVVTI